MESELYKTLKIGIFVGKMFCDKLMLTFLASWFSVQSSLCGRKCMMEECVDVKLFQTDHIQNHHISLSSPVMALTPCLAQVLLKRVYYSDGSLIYHFSSICKMNVYSSISQPGLKWLVLRKYSWKTSESSFYVLGHWDAAHRFVVSLDSKQVYVCWKNQIVVNRVQDWQ